MPDQQQPQQIDLKCDLPFSEFIDPWSITDIVDCRTFRDGAWKNLTQLRNVLRGGHKNVIPVDISTLKFVVVATVEPGSVIPSHTHDEPILRYIMSGSLTLNDRSYQTGDWVLVPANFPYTVKTEEGYVALNPYGMSCQCSGSSC